MIKLLGKTKTAFKTQANNKRMEIIKMTTKEQYVLENAKLKNKINQLEIKLRNIENKEKQKGLIRKGFGLIKKAIVCLW